MIGCQFGHAALIGADSGIGGALITGACLRRAARPRLTARRRLPTDGRLVAAAAVEVGVRAGGRGAPCLLTGHHADQRVQNTAATHRGRVQDRATLHDSGKYRTRFVGR